MEKEVGNKNTEQNNKLTNFAIEKGTDFGTSIMGVLVGVAVGESVGLLLEQ